MNESVKGVSRRRFVQAGIGGLVGMGAFPVAARAQQKEAAKAVAPKLVHRTLGKTGIKLPVVSMGVMNADNPNLVRAALDAGIVMLDTAHGYQRGRNEEMIGRVIKDRPRDSYVIATKVPGEPQNRQTGQYSAETTGEAFMEKLDLSLKRLGIPSVDILYLHGVSKREAVLFEPLLKVLEKAKRDGKTRFIGISTHQNEPEAILAAVDGKVHDVVLTSLNFREDHHLETRKAIAKAADAGLGIVAMKTLAGGFWDKEKQQPINMKAALKWVLQDPNVHTAIPGFTTFEQMHEDLSVMENLALTEKEKSDLVPPPKLTGFYCQQCARCLPQCPAGLPIPDLMRGYMYARAYRNYREAQDLIVSLNLPADACRTCSSCAVQCAKGHDVAERIRDVLALRALPETFFG